MSARFGEGVLKLLRNKIICLFLMFGSILVPWIWEISRKKDKVTSIAEREKSINKYFFIYLKSIIKSRTLGLILLS